MFRRLRHLRIRSVPRQTMAGFYISYMAFFSFICCSGAFLSDISTCSNTLIQHSFRNGKNMFMALGDFTVTLEKPLGIILEENAVGGGGGVYVKEVIPQRSADNSRSIVAGDVLLQIGDENVSDQDFDTVMEMLMTASSPVTLTLGDGLGILDMPKNVVRTLQSTEDAYFIDAVVRQAVREIRRDHKAAVGQLVRVEVVVGAGVEKQTSSPQGKFNQKLRGRVRFFAIFNDRWWTFHL